MSTTMNALRIRSVLGRREWGPPQPFGPDGWKLRRFDGRSDVIVSASAFDDGVEYIHASIAYADGLTMPTYDNLALLHRAVFGDGYAYQVFAPSRQHVNIHNTALHLWGRADGAPVMPEFGSQGSI